MLVRRRHALIPGRRVLIGFSELFEGAYGNPNTPQPYPKVTPSRVGPTLLPFPCPHCGQVRAVLTQPRKREGYSDAERGFSWCPACGGRYVLDAAGQPLAKPLPADATYAPATVERNGKKTLEGLPQADGLDDLGAC